MPNCCPIESFRFRFRFERCACVGPQSAPCMCDHMGKRHTGYLKFIYCMVGSHLIRLDFTVTFPLLTAKYLFCLYFLILRSSKPCLKCFGSILKPVQSLIVLRYSLSVHHPFWQDNRRTATTNTTILPNGSLPSHHLAVYLICLMHGGVEHLTSTLSSTAVSKRV